MVGFGPNSYQEKKIELFPTFHEKKKFLKNGFLSMITASNMHSKLSNLAPAFKRYRANTFATSYCFDRKVKVFLPPKTRFLGSCGVPSSVWAPWHGSKNGMFENACTIWGLLRKYCFFFLLAYGRLWMSKLFRTHSKKKKMTIFQLFMKKKSF